MLQSHPSRSKGRSSITLAKLLAALNHPHIATVFGLAPNGFGGRAWDLDPVAERFLMINLPGVTGEQGAEARLPRIHIVLNWFEDVAARAPRP